MMDLVTLVMACSVFQNYSITNAMIQQGSKNTPSLVTSLSNARATVFPTEAQAASFIQQQLQANQPVAIGVTQLPSRWLKIYGITPAESVRPCKNVVVATQIITQSWEKCGHLVADPSDPEQVQACALSMFKTGDPQAGLSYATNVMHYAAQHPFDKLAAPAMAHWEKNAQVPVLSAAEMAKLAAQKKATPAQPVADTSVKADTDVESDGDSDSDIEN